MSTTPFAHCWVLCCLLWGCGFIVPLSVFVSVSDVSARASASAVRLRAIFTKVAPCWLALVSSLVCMSGLSTVVSGGGAIVFTMLGVLLCSSLRAARRRYHKSFFSISGLPMIMSYGRFLNTRKIKGTCRASFLSLLFDLLLLHSNVPSWVGMFIKIFMKWADNWH